MEHYVTMAPEALDSLTPEERHQLYEILRLRVTADEDRNLTAEGMFGEFSVSYETRTCMQGLVYRLRRIPLPRIPVNRARACLAAPNPKTRGPKLVR